MRRFRLISVVGARTQGGRGRSRRRQRRDLTLWIVETCVLTGALYGVLYLFCLGLGGLLRAAGV